VLVEASHDPELHVRRAALAAMAALQAPPPEALQRLRDVLAGDPDGSSRRIAAVAMGEIAAREGADAETEAALLAAEAESADTDLRRAAKRALARAGAQREGSP
jgi:hypothetical protein